MAPTKPPYPWPTTIDPRVRPQHRDAQHIFTVHHMRDDGPGHTVTFPLFTDCEGEALLDLLLAMMFRRGLCLQEMRADIAWQLECGASWNTALRRLLAWHSHAAPYSIDWMWAARGDLL